MNIKKAVDYTAMFKKLDILMASDLQQIELYCEIGKAVSSRPEKGAAVMASEYLCATYPDISGFSSRNLRRMREFYRTYKAAPEILAHAMTIGWTQNVVILEAELTLPEREWYIQAVQQFGWSKLELQRMITVKAHLEMALDFKDKVCYTEKKDAKPKRPILQPVRSYRHQGNQQSVLSPALPQIGQAWYQLRTLLRRRTELAYQVHEPP